MKPEPNSILLTNENITKLDLKDVTGVYIIFDCKGKIKTLSRSVDLNYRLKDCRYNMSGQPDPKHFKYWIMDNQIDAYYKSCELFHEYCSSGNLVHPRKPKNTTVFCPVNQCRIGKNS